MMIDMYTHPSIFNTHRSNLCLCGYSVLDWLCPVFPPNLRSHKPLSTRVCEDTNLGVSQHKNIATKLSIKTYFTRPYTSQDKGTIENRNGVIRQFFPKKTDFNLIDRKELRKVEKLINNRPVRKFNYLTPNEVFLQLTG